jgi:hypothetical protein
MFFPIVLFTWDQKTELTYNQGIPVKKKFKKMGLAWLKSAVMPLMRVT